MLGLGTHLHLVTLVVREYQPAIDFFVKVLHFELVEDVPSLTNGGRPKRWVVVRPAGAATGILLARADGDRQREVVGHQFAGRVGFFLRVGDFDASHARMLAAGVEFVSPPRAEAYGQVAVFLDLEGNRWDLLGPRQDLRSVLNDPASGSGERSIALALSFLGRVWGPTHDLDAIDELMTEDYRITSGGTVIAGRAAFKQWVRQFQAQYGDARTEPLEAFANPAGDRVVVRWANTGTNKGIFGLPPDGRPVGFTGIAVWRVAGDRLAECWVERAAYEAYRNLTTTL